MTLGAIDLTPGIGACIMAGMTGEYSAEALPDLLWGKISPSGRTADTWAYNFSTAASYANAAANGVGLIKMEKVCIPLMVQKAVIWENSLNMTRYLCGLCRGYLYWL